MDLYWLRKIYKALFAIGVWLAVIAATLAILCVKVLLG